MNSESDVIDRKYSENWACQIKYSGMLLSSVGI